MNDIARYERIDEKRELELAEIIQAEGKGAKEALNELILSNLKLVISIANRYKSNCSESGLSFDDLINEGNIGLIIAAKKFKKDKGAKFSSYASWWIRLKISRIILEQSKTVRVPNNRQFVVQRAKKNGEDFSKLFDVSVIYETEIGEDIVDNIADERMMGEEALINKIFIEELLSDLKTEERKIVELYFGINTRSTVKITFREIAEELNLKQENVRKILKRTLKKLKENMIF